MYDEVQGTFYQSCSRISFGNGCDPPSAVDEGSLGIPEDVESSLLLIGEAISYVGRDCRNECMGKECERREREEDVENSCRGRCQRVEHGRRSLVAVSDKED